MRARHLLVAAIWAAASSASAQPGAQPKDDTESDGPEAQSELPIKLDDLIEVAVRLSPDLARAKVDRTTAHETAGGERKSQAWVLSSGINYAKNGIADHVEAPPYSVVSSEKIGANVGIGRNLPTGGSFSLELDVQHTNSEYNIVNTLQSSTSASTTMTPPGGTDANGNPLENSIVTQTALRATLKQPLLRGLGSEIALAPLKKADLAATEATIKAQLAAEQMIHDIVVGYWELAYAAFEADVRQQSLELAKKQEELTHEQMRAGSTPANSLNTVVFEISTREEALLRAQLTVEQKSLELREKAGLELGRRNILMRPGEPFEIGDAEFDVDEVLARSRLSNRQLATLQLEKKLADVDIAVANDAARPQMDLQLEGAVIGNGEGAGDSLDSLGSGDGYEVTVGLSMSFELSGAARKARRAAESKRHRLDIDRAALERQIDTQVVTAVHQVTAARKRVELAEKSINVAEDNVRAERTSFMAGRSTNFQVMQMQTKLIEARLSKGRAVADYHEAVAQLQFLSGLLLDQYHVNVRPHAMERR